MSNPSGAPRGMRQRVLGRQGGGDVPPVEPIGYEPGGTAGNPPGVPGPVVPLPGRTTHEQIGDITGGPIDAAQWHAASAGLKKLFIKAWILKACQAEGVDPAVWAPPYELLISRESGGYTGGIGDPNIVNLYDENAKAGIPSMGLAQVIQPNAPGENLLDPVVNIRASIRHIKATYGDITKVQQADPTKPAKGYQTGGSTDSPNSGTLFPLFTEEGPQFADAAYAHNKPFATAGPYQTPLSPDEESAFQSWAKTNKVPWHDDGKSDYDMRGYWKQYQPQGRPAFYTDTYKTPYDTTFSGLSKFATADCPFVWKDGATLIDKRDGSIVFLNPTHYASEQPQRMDTPGFAPPDTGGKVRPSTGYQTGGLAENAGLKGSPTAPGAAAPPDRTGYGTQWKLGVQHADGSISPLPISMSAQRGGQAHWDGSVALRAGDRVVVITT